MLDPATLPPLSAECEIRIPGPGAKVEDFVSRWSNTQLSLPAAVIVPATEDDVVAMIKYAVANGLKVIPAGGGHGTFVPINDRSLYLDLRNFKNIELDENAGAVTFGGGVVSGEVLRYLGERGWYTSVPNSNGVGMVGYCLGGGSSPFNGLKGLAIDNIVRVRVIAADGVTRELHPASSGDEGDLFNVLRGAGFGFGVITSVTLRAWPQAELGLEDGKMWTRRLIFPPPAIKAAAELFAKLQHLEPKLLATLLLMRAPPSAPKPGAPMIVLIVSYLGSAAEAEKAAAATFEEHFTSQAIVAVTDATPLSAMNDVAAPLDRHGDYKEQYSAWCSHVSPETIVSVFNHWIAFGEGTPEAKATSFLVFAAKGTKGMLEHDLEGKTFVPRTIRSRNVFVQAVPWWTDETVEPRARSWAAETMAMVNAPQHVQTLPEAEKNGFAEKDGERVTAFAANLSKGIDLTTTWTGEQLDEIQRAKSIWDAGNVFWNPVVDGV